MTINAYACRLNCALAVAALMAVSSGCCLVCPGPGMAGPGPHGAALGSDHGLPCNGQCQGSADCTTCASGPIVTGLDLFLPARGGQFACSDGCGEVVWCDWMIDPPERCDPCGSLCGGPRWLYGEHWAGHECGSCCSRLAHLVYGTFSFASDWDFGLRLLVPCSVPVENSAFGPVGWDESAVIEGAEMDSVLISGEVAEPEYVNEPLPAGDPVPPDSFQPLGSGYAAADAPIAAPRSAIDRLMHRRPVRSRPPHRVTARHLGPVRSATLVP